MASMKKQFGAGLIGFGLGLASGINISLPFIGSINQFVWIIILIVGIVLYVKS
jgi:hypothetical protein